MSRRALLIPDAESGRGVAAVAEVTDPAALARLAPAWRTLADRCPAATVFQTYEWNAAWWRHFGGRPGRRLRVLCFRDAHGGLVGLAPMVTSFWHGTPWRRLSLMGTGASDYLDVLAAAGWEDTVVEAFYAHLAQMHTWHAADLHQLREGGVLRARPPSLASGLDWMDTEGEACPFLPLPADWETLTQSWGKKTRANIGYYTRSLSKLYEVEMGPVTQPEALDGELASLFLLHQRRWNQRWFPGVFGSRRVQQFHRDAARALLQRGFLRLFTLKLDGETQAALYCFAFGDRICYYQGGFEPTLAKMSLGTVLTAHAIQTALGEGRAVFDFLRGDEPYKAKWTGNAARNVRRLLVKEGTRQNFGPLARRVQKIEDALEARAKSWARARQSP